LARLAGRSQERILEGLDAPRRAPRLERGGEMRSYLRVSGAAGGEHVPRPCQLRLGENCLELLVDVIEGGSLTQSERHAIDLLRPAKIARLLVIEAHGRRQPIALAQGFAQQHVEVAF